GMTPTLSHDFFSKLPAVLQPLLHSGIMLATLSAVVLNVFFNGRKSTPRCIASQKYTAGKVWS
ncbi:purine permease, partial [Escherichia coli]